jgi:hypothetical protein
MYWERLIMFWRWLCRRKRTILTLGSVHLDTIAVASNNSRFFGRITHSIGGSAYNIAINLARYAPNKKHIKAAVYTILPEHSIITDMIRYKLQQAKVSTDYMCIQDRFEDSRVRGGGYVAIIDDGNDKDQKQGKRSVIDPALRKEHFFQNEDERDGRIDTAIEWADYLVADVNLSSSVIDSTAEHAQTEEKPVFVRLGSSEQAAESNWLKNKDEKRAVCVAGRSEIIVQLLQLLKQPDLSLELKSLGENPDSRYVNVSRICEELQTRHVLCYYSSGRYALLVAREKSPEFCFVKELDSKQHAGIVDAVLAGFISTYSYFTRYMGRKYAIRRFEEKDLEQIKFIDHLQHNIKKIVEDTQKFEGATAGSLISFEEVDTENGFLAFLRQTANRVKNHFPTLVFLGKTASWVISLLVGVALVHERLHYLHYWVDYISGDLH